MTAPSTHVELQGSQDIAARRGTGWRTRSRPSAARELQRPGRPGRGSIPLGRDDIGAHELRSEAHEPAPFTGSQSTSQSKPRPCRSPAARSRCRTERAIRGDVGLELALAVAMTPFASAGLRTAPSCRCRTDSEPSRWRTATLSSPRTGACGSCRPVRRASSRRRRGRRAGPPSSAIERTLHSWAAWVGTRPIRSLISPGARRRRDSSHGPGRRSASYRRRGDGEDDRAVGADLGSSILPTGGCSSMALRGRRRGSSADRRRRSGSPERCGRPADETVMDEGRRVSPFFRST